ncbi:CYTH and CHAD domain-containing protein [Goodfellowiella coeruleoviolacea]|uniref:CYTH and CHAD domain-containing protein n=1 Tax=Goodfellowiella coeruleoviolacea TaxID=334858 RepID=UPI0020A383F9|nr:CYTH and CHAD domain-containing protein [Goodfellowiella coeruleoviolacea]
MRETERKYEAPTGVALPTWDGLPGVAGVSGPDEVLLDAEYHDTEDLRLARAGVTLRRRTGGEDAGWHLKLPAGADTRDELGVPLGPEHQRPPEELTSLVRARTRGARLLPVARIATRRSRWRLTGDTGQLLAEVVADQVTASVLSGPSKQDEWREVEVELGADADPGLLDAVEDRLVAAGLHRSTRSAKLARVLGDRLTPATPARVPVDAATAGGTVLAYLRDQVAAVYRLDPAVRRGLPDAVHQQRVAMRRLRSALQAFGRVVDRERTRDLTDELRWAAGVLGAARDLEVLADRLEQAVAALPDDLVVGPVRAQLTRHFAPGQAAAQQAVLAALDSPRYSALLDRLDALLVDPPFTPRAALPAEDVLPAQVARADRRLRRRMRAVGETGSAGADRDVALHEARKAAKRLRYAVEVVEPLVGRRAVRFRKRVKAVQQVLGDHQDGVLARPLLRQLGMRSQLEGENGFTFGLLHGRELSRADQVLTTLARPWRRLAKPRVRRWLTS